MIENGLSKEEMDFVTEALTIGAGNAATALSQMLGCNVELSGPKVSFLSPEEVPSIFEDQSLQAFVAKIGFVGDMKGGSYYIVKEVDVRDLVHMIEKTFPVDEEAGIAEVSVIEETANIITGVYFSALGNFCGLNVNQTIPVVSSSTLQALTDEFKGKGDQLKGMELIAIINELTVAERRMVTYLLLALSDEALKILSLKIAEARRKLEIKGLEEKVAHRTLELQTVVETAGEGIIGMRPPGEIYLWNKKAEEMFGYPAEEAIGKEIHTLITPERYREKARDGYRAFLQTGTGPIVGKTIEIEALRKDGTEFPVELSVSAMNIRGEWHSTGIVRDITERKKAEQDSARLVAILEATTDFVGFADSGDTHISYINPAGRRMVGIGADEDVTKLKIADVHPAWTNKLFAEVILPTAMRDGVWSGECAFLNRDGREIPVLMVLLSHKDASGRVAIFSTISRDITEKKAAEDKLLKQLDELKRWQKATVGREIRMHEIKEEDKRLKEKIEELESKLGKGTGGV